MSHLYADNTASYSDSQVSSYTAPPSIDCPCCGETLELSEYAPHWVTPANLLAAHVEEEHSAQDMEKAQRRERHITPKRLDVG
jgi:hypothetical protein